MNEPREHHRRQLLEVLGRLADEAERSGDLDAALDRTRDQVALDPLSEEAQRDLMRRLAAVGDRAGALAAYKSYGTRLRHDLGIAPSAGIREMADGVRGGSSPPGTGPAPHPDMNRPRLTTRGARIAGMRTRPPGVFAALADIRFFGLAPYAARRTLRESTFAEPVALHSSRVPRVAAALEGERRWATVLFGDLAGFTHLSETTDHEDVRLMVDRCTSQMGEIVDGYGGWIDKVIGDALMAVRTSVATTTTPSARFAPASSSSATRLRTPRTSVGWLSGLAWTAER